MAHLQTVNSVIDGSQDVFDVKSCSSAVLDLSQGADFCSVVHVDVAPRDAGSLSPEEVLLV